MNNSYLVEPITYQILFALRTAYNPKMDEYKYKIMVGIEKVVMNINPVTI